MLDIFEDIFESSGVSFALCVIVLFEFPSYTTAMLVGISFSDLGDSLLLS